MRTYSERDDDEEWPSSAPQRSIEVFAEGMLLATRGRERGGAYEGGGMFLRSLVVAPAKDLQEKK